VNLGFLIATAVASISVFSRVVDRNDKGAWILWRSAYLPDGLHYILQAIKISPFGSRHLMLEKLNVLYPNAIETVSSQSNRILDTLHARPLYPVLTSFFLNTNFEVAPLLAPILSWLSLNLLIFQHIRIKHGIFYALFIVFAFSGSFYMRLDFIGTTTDSLCALFCYLAFYYLFKPNPDLTKLLLINFFVILSVLCRPVDPIFLVLIIGMIMQNYRNRTVVRNLLITLTLILSHLIYIQLMYHQLETGATNTGGSISGDFLNYIIESILRTPKLIFLEFGFVLSHDFLLFLLIIWSWVVLSTLKSKPMTSQYFIVFFSTFFLASLNGTMGSGFRYELPIVMLSLVVIANGDSPQKIWATLSRYIYQV